MATPSERSGGIRERLNARSNGLSSRTQDRSDGIQERLNQRHQRKAGELVQNLLDMTDTGRPLPSLKREEPRGGIPQRRGYAEKNYQPGTGEATGGGIASPLIEGATAGADPAAPVLDREYHPTGLYYSTDYTLAVQMRPLKTLTMRDANGAEVDLVFAEPDAEEPI